MTRHKWDQNNQCSVCKVYREMQTRKLLMAIVNHPPWEAYKYDRMYAYSFDLKKWSFVRPDCKSPQLELKNAD